MNHCYDAVNGNGECCGPVAHAYDAVNEDNEVEGYVYLCERHLALWREVDDVPLLATDTKLFADGQEIKSLSQLKSL